LFSLHPTLAKSKVKRKRITQGCRKKVSKDKKFSVKERKIYLTFAPSPLPSFIFALPSFIFALPSFIFGRKIKGGATQGEWK
jgi:hypothetical protein